MSSLVSRRRFVALGAGAVATVACGDGGPAPQPAKAPVLASKPNEAPVAQLVVTGGTILTLDPARPTAEAVAIRDGRVLALGTEAEIGHMRSASTHVVGLQYGVAVPGFTVTGVDVGALGRDLDEQSGGDPTRENVESWILGAQAHLHARGVTRVFDMGVDAATHAAYLALEKAGKLHLRVRGHATARWFETGMVGTIEPHTCGATSRYCLEGLVLEPDQLQGKLAVQARESGWRVVPAAAAAPSVQMTERLSAALAGAGSTRPSLEEALRVLTFDGGGGPEAGALAVGRPADLACFRADLRKLDPAALGATAVYATVMGGKIVYRA